MRIAKLKLPWLGESISSGSSGNWQTRRYLTSGSELDESLNRINSSRFYVFYVIGFLILLLFLARLFGLAVIAGSQNRELSQNNRIRLFEREAQRGRIFDRDGKIIAESKVVHLLKKNDKLTQISAGQAKDLEMQGLASENFEGELGQISQEVRRSYLLSAASAHILGYTSWGQGVQAIGMLGIEQAYNSFLTGKVGKKLVEVDTLGRKVSILGEQESVRGRDLKTTLDADLQKFAFDVLKKQAEKFGTKKGAVVVQNPRSGEILALVSSPSFDPADIGKSVSDLEKPFFNRATQGSYPPGSVFKIVTALAGLESGLIDENTQIEDVGEFELGGSKFSNWFFNQYGKRDGVLKIQKAIARSNDIFFYRVAEKVGLKTLRVMAIKLGLGQKTGIDLPAEAVGLVPDEVWKKSAFGDDWYLGDTMHFGIGQGFLLTTPLQLNSITSFVASGILTKPYVVSEIGSGDSDVVKFSGKVLAEDIVGRENLDLVRAGMRDACKAGGTGAPFFSAPYDVACKTGTAEKELGNPHAWFTVYAPYDDPQIALTVIIEDGGEGSSVAAPVAREIVDWWMANRAR